MSKVRHPRLKKKLSLARDHRVFKLEGDKTFRKKWPKVKAAAKRRVRRAEQVALQEAVASPEAGDIAVQEARSGDKRRLQKLGVVTLAQQIEVKADKKLRWTSVTQTTNKETRRAKIRKTKSRVS